MITQAMCTRVMHRSSQRVTTRASRMIVRAQTDDATSTSGESPKGVVFYTDNNGSRVQSTEAEYQAALSGGKTYRASSITGVALGTTGEGSSAVEQVPLMDVMAFSGAGPELINGRLAMIAFAAAAAAEASSGKTVGAQFSEEPTLIVLTAILLAAGSLVTMVKNVEVTGLGVFGADKEMFNGRAAMLGFASLLIVEGFTGEAFF